MFSLFSGWRRREIGKIINTPQGVLLKIDESMIQTILSIMCIFPTRRSYVGWQGRFPLKLLLINNVKYCSQDCTVI